MPVMIRIICAMFFVIMLSGCDNAINYAGAQYLKISLKEVCGEEDRECIAAVDKQFDPCHDKFKADWAAYMKASASKEDEYLVCYSENMYGCIVDKDGIPYFVFDPEA